MAQLDSTRSTGACSSTPQIKTRPNHEPDIQLSRSPGINNFFACSGHEYTLTPQCHPRYVKTTFDQSDGQDNLSGQTPEVPASTSAFGSVPLHDQFDGLPSTQTLADLFQPDHITTPEATICTSIKSNVGPTAVRPMVIKQEAYVESMVPETQPSYEKYTSGTSWKRKAIESDQDDEEIKYSAKVPRTSVSHPSDYSSHQAQDRVGCTKFDRPQAKLEVTHAIDGVKAAMTKVKQRYAEYLKVIRNPVNEEELRHTLAVAAKLIGSLEVDSDMVTAEQRVMSDSVMLSDEMQSRKLS
ncbi:hypothetical protein LTR17_000449 [Elasticomyces elasticus]|nr:hypothetical protein LTR17_000449 [Elasticomyces elasticus]